MRCAVAMGWFLLLGGVASASGQPFGSNGLPYFVANADAIIQSGECSLVERTDFARIVLVQVRKSLRGKTIEATSVRVLLRGAGPREKTIDEFAPLPNATLFLTVPIPPDELTIYEVQDSNTPVRGLVSDSSAVPLGNQDQQQVIARYLDLGNDDLKSRVQWARDYLVSSDPVIKRWSLLEAGDLVGKGSFELAEDLAKVAREDLSPALQPLLVMQLTTLRAMADEQKQESAKEAASNGLLAIIGSSNASIPLQHQAYSVFPRKERLGIFKRWKADNPELIKSRPDFSWIADLDDMSSVEKQGVLLNWCSSGDSTKRQWGALLRTAESHEEITDAQFGELEKRIRSQSAFERVSAIKDLNKYNSSDRLLALANEILAKESESDYVRSQAIDALAAWGSGGAIDQLVAFALDANRPKDLRTSSVLAIGLSAVDDVDEAKEALAKLAETLQDSALKDLAKTLSKRP